MESLYFCYISWWKLPQYSVQLLVWPTTFCSKIINMDGPNGQQQPSGASPARSPTDLSTNNMASSHSGMFSYTLQFLIHRSQCKTWKCAFHFKLIIIDFSGFWFVVKDYLVYSLKWGVLYLLLKSPPINACVAKILHTKKLIYCYNVSSLSSKFDCWVIFIYPLSSQVTNPLLKCLLWDLV